MRATAQMVHKQDGELTSSWSMSQSPVMTIRFSILVSDRPPFSVCRYRTSPVMDAAWQKRQEVLVCGCVRTLVMCVVVVVHRDSDVIVWAVIRTPGSPSPLPSNWEQRRQKQIRNGTRSQVYLQIPLGEEASCHHALALERKFQQQP